MKEQNDIIKRIIAFIRERYSLEGEIDENFSVNNDMDLMGEDADDFLERFMREFRVDLTGIPYHRYFLDEGELSLLFFIKRKKRIKEIRKNNLTILQLANIVKNGKWVEESESKQER